MNARFHPRGNRCGDKPPWWRSTRRRTHIGDKRDTNTYFTYKSRCPSRERSGVRPCLFSVDGPDASVRIRPSAGYTRPRAGPARRICRASFAVPRDDLGLHARCGRYLVRAAFCEAGHGAARPLGRPGRGHTECLRLSSLASLTALPTALRPSLSNFLPHLGRRVHT